MKLKLLLKTSFLTALLFFAGKTGWAQTNVTVFSEDFNRGANVTPVTDGGTPLMTWTTVGTAATPGTSYTNPATIDPTNYVLQMYANVATPVAGYVYVTGPLSTISSPFNGTLNSNSEVTWTFNMKSTRSNALIGFGGTTYGSATVLASSGPNPTTGTTGYAVALYKGTTNNAIRLVRFSNGIATATITSIVGPSADLASMTNFASIKVVYTSATNTWKLYVRDDASTTDPTDPTTGNLILVGSAVDATYTSTAMTHCGFLWSGSTATPTSNKGVYDNFKVQVAVNDPVGTDVTTYSLPSQIGSSNIDLANHKIDISLPYGTDPSALIGTFTLSSSSAVATVAAANQVSGTTPNNFSSPLTYLVTSADASSTQEWTVTLHFKPKDAATITSSGYTANWTAVSGAASYDVNTFINGYLVKTTNVSALTADITGLLMGTDYTYQVVAKAGDGSVIETSLNSTAFKTLTLSVSSINTNFNDGNWGKVYPTPSSNPLTPQSGSYPSYWVNGNYLAKAFIYGAKTTDQKGNTEQNVVKIDKSSYMELPTISGPIEQIEIHAFFGSGDKIFNLQELQLDGTTWTKVGGDYTWGAQSKLDGTDSIYYIPLSRAIPTKLRIVNTTTSSFNISKVLTRTTNPTTTLPSPAVGVASNISSSGFTANWTAVPNATGYRVALLNSTGFLDLSYTINGQATESMPIAGLDTITVTSYKVSAIGDDVTNLDSYLSAAATTFELRLATPIVGGGSAITGDGFTANWAAISNASGYDVNVYQGLTLVSTTPASGQATTNVAIKGLLSNTAYTFTVIAKGDGTTTFNSLVSDASLSVTTKTSAEIILGNKTVTYNSLSQSIDAAVTTPVSLTVDYSYNGSAIAPSAAGTYEVIAVINDATYSGVDTATLTIEKALITVTVNAGLTKVFTAVDPDLTYTVSPALESGDAFTGLLSRASGENVGSYEIAKGDLSAGANYTITFVADNLAITAKPVTVTADANKTKVYGSADPEFTFTFDPALESGDSFTGSLGREAGVIVGSYAITKGSLSAGSNYDITLVSNNFTITAKAITVTAVAAQTKVYGEVDPTYTYTVSPALESGDSFTGNLSRAAGKNVGTYAISIGTLSAGTNYDLTFVAKDFSITAKHITVTADENLTKSAGTVDPTFTYTVNPALESGDAFTGSLSRAAGETIGDYAIQLGSLSAGANYSITFVDATFAISKGVAVELIDADKVRIYSDTRNIFVDIATLESTAHIAVYNILGKQLYQSTNLSQGMNRIETDFNSGAYIVKLMVGKKVYTQKVMLQK
jgi:hypothetical protein